MIQVSIIKVAGKFSRIDYDIYSLTSYPQLKEFLFTLGWVPDEWNTDDDGNKTSPKITTSSLSSIGDEELGLLLKRMFVLRHRRSFLENKKRPQELGLLSKIRGDGRVASEAITCGTPTARYKHRAPIANVPKAKKKVLYGKEMREVYCCKPPYILVGSDLSGIEARLLGHYAWPYDGGELAFDLLQGDVHTKTAMMLGVDRDTAKTFRYAAMYGAGGAKIGRTIGVSTTQGQRKLDEFFEKSKGLGGIKRDLERAYKKNKYIRGLDGRRLHIRGKHILLNSLIQSSAAIIFKYWSTLVWEEIERKGMDAEIIIMYHDEFQMRAMYNDLVELRAILAMTLLETEQHFNLRVPLTTDTKAGMNWADTH